MIRWHDSFLVGESIRKKKRKIISNIESHSLQFGVCVVVLSVNGHDIFDIIPSWMLSEDGYHGSDIEILAVAGDRDEAMELCAALIDEAYDSCGTYDKVREFYS